MVLHPDPVAGFLPWAVALIPATVWGWRAPSQLSNRNQIFAPLKFVLLFSAFIMLFFSNSGSKLPHYILPFFPVLALVIGAYLRQVDSRRLAWLVLPVFPFGLAGAWAAWEAPARRAPEAFSTQMYETMSLWVTGASLIIGLAALLAFFALRAERKWLGVLLVSLGTMIGVELIERGYEHISPLQSGAALAQSIKAKMEPDTRLYSVDNYDQSLPFYLKQTLTLVDYVDEFELGEKAAPEKWIHRLEDFPAAWNAPGNAIAIIGPGEVEKMKSLGLSFDIIHQDPRRIAIRKKITP